MNVRRLLSVFLALAGIASARTALAVCMGAQEYRISPMGSTLSIVPTNFQGRRCGDADGLLRQNVDTGEVVKLVGLLPGAMTGYCAGEGYLDECVPVGKYRYGLARPYRCCQSCCKTEYFVEIMVAVPPAANCEATRRPDNPRPVAYTGPVPWTNSKDICLYVPPPDAAPRPRASETDAGEQPPPGGGAVNTGRSQNRGGCSVGGAGGSGTALLLPGLALLVGFVRTARRRRNPRASRESAVAIAGFPRKLGPG